MIILKNKMNNMKNAKKGSTVTNSKQPSRPNIPQADFTTSVKAPKS